MKEIVKMNNHQKFKNLYKVNRHKSMINRFGNDNIINPIICTSLKFNPYLKYLLISHKKVNFEY